MTSNDKNKKENTKGQDQRVLQLRVALTGNVDQESTLPDRERAVNPDDTVVFNTPDVFQDAVTPQRTEIIDVLVEYARPVEINTISRTVNRGTEKVRNDAETLSSHGIIELTEIDNTMMAYLPYDTVRVDVDFPVMSSDSTEET